MCSGKFTRATLQWMFLSTILSAIAQLISIDAKSQYTKLFDFGSSLNGTGAYGPVVTDGTYLYGMTNGGGANSLGIIYKMKTDGSGFTKLLDFNGTTNGASPYGALLYDGTYLYGMTLYGGANNQGVIFKILTDGTGYTKLLDFSSSATGQNPLGSLISDGTYLYGTTNSGGSFNLGTVFKIKLDGTGYTNLHNFDSYATGGYPNCTLYSDGTYLYGTTPNGGANYDGIIFRVQTDGSNYAKLFDLTYTTGTTPVGSIISDGTYMYATNSYGGTNGSGTIFKFMPDGSSSTKILDFNSTTPGGYPKGSLSYDGTFLYGTTASYGANGAGTIFKVKPDGTGLVTLFDNDINNQNSYADDILVISGSTLYGVKGGGAGGATPEYPGTVFKVNNDGSGYTKLHFFEAEASSPSAALYYDGTYFYSMALSNGLYNVGSLFRIKPDGSGFQDLYDFGGTNDGSSPSGTVMSDGTFLYGMTQSGGANGFGTIFKIKPDGTGYSKFYDFDGTNGSNPNGSLYYDGTFLYGMTQQGGANSYGVIFKISPAGAFTKLFDFDGSTTGGTPHGSLISDGTFLYGTTYQGGASGVGTIFKIMPNGSNFTKLLDFDDTNLGAYPTCDLFYDGTFLYASVYYGGASGNGTIMKVKPDGTGAVKLLDFDHTNTGSNPQGSLVSDGTYLYGVTQSGGYTNSGTLFRIKPDGTSFQKYFDFADGNDAIGSPMISGSSIYGTTSSGGANNGGILFKTTLTPFVDISGFKPSGGVVGTYVTISGVDFDATPTNNVVKFNGVNAIVKSGIGSSLVVVVPNGATTGKISITANGFTVATATNFTVTTNSDMISGTIQSCNASFSAPIDQGESASYVETFVPVGGGKITVSFSSFSSNAELDVYDGPSTSSPLVVALTGNSAPADITATSAGGELTFAWQWQDVSGTSSWQATISCAGGGSPPVIATKTLVTQVGSSGKLNLVSLVSTSQNNLDTTSLSIIVPPVYGNASIDATGVLTVDYTGVTYVGLDSLTFQACDKTGVCASQQIYIDVIGDIVVYNGISPGGKNPSFVIQYIDVIPETKNNTVYIFDRWENMVWHGANYDNTAVVFTGTSDSGNALPSGVYFYKIDFASGRSTKTGFISLRR